MATTAPELARRGSQDELAQLQAMAAVNVAGAPAATPAIARLSSDGSSAAAADPAAIDAASFSSFIESGFGAAAGGAGGPNYRSVQVRDPAAAAAAAAAAVGPAARPTSAASAHATALSGEPSVSRSTSGGAAGAAAGLPVAMVLSDLSAREGPCSGGIKVWLHGRGFTSDTVVQFGGALASSISVTSPELIKCLAPPCASPTRVPVAVVSATTGAKAENKLWFTYTVCTGSGGGSAGVDRDLLRRILASLERAQTSAKAAAAAATAATSMQVSSATAAARADYFLDGGPAEAGISAFAAMDEHGYSLEEYTVELRRSLGPASAGMLGPGAGTIEASELQLQHVELAEMVKRERLSAAFANRPAMEQLQERNILPDAEAHDRRRQQLSASLANRPEMEALQQRHILKGPDEAPDAMLAKRKRLEGFLAGRRACGHGGLAARRS